MTPVPVEEFDELITEAHTLWRWEAQPAYHEPEEAEPFARWQRHEPDDFAWFQGWLAHLRTATANGRQYARVRRLAEPPTDYQRWSLTVAARNVEAGEDVRLLSASKADEFGLPSYDFVIIDDLDVLRMRFGPNGFVGAERIDDQHAIARHRIWRTVAWEHATTFTAYTSRSP